MSQIEFHGIVLNEVVEKVGNFHQESAWHVVGTYAMEATPMLALIEAERLAILSEIEVGEKWFPTATDYAEYCADFVELALTQRELLQHRLLMGCVKFSASRAKS